MKVRYLIKYSKGSDIKFVGHLDLMRTIQRAIKRADLPIEYSHGFNPHMTMSIAQPLSVGVYSDGEYMDVKFSDEIPESEVKEKFNKASTNALKIVDVVKIRNEYYPSGKKVESSMAVIEAAVYDIKIKYENTSKLKEEMESLLKSEDWSILKKTKKSEKIVNIKSMVKKLSYNIEDNVLKIRTAISSGSRENLSPDLLCDYIKKNTNSVLKDSFTDIKRVEMYAIKNKKLVPLNKYFS
ncbi:MULTISPECIES: TIGR03936 family radical SAM-associated protein [Clostridium]|uniref:TIGR03936 family radical SAM-associated protein n=1 Tax=Clostridium TaxID=1485 RepID=UPI0008264A29|nr:MULTISPECIES: TIGR03936 family radical SAM-associated protein [Clostridium]PJI07122.1 radical SAM protein [Clostridium sp. CT7]